MIVKSKTQESNPLLHPPGEVLSVRQDLMDESLVQAAIHCSLVGGGHRVNDITVIHTCQAARGVESS